MDQLKYNKVVALLDECIEHLEYCGYGDAWERECAEDLMKKIEVYQAETTRKEFLIEQQEHKYDG